MNVREQRGRELADRARITRKGGAWVVPSTDGLRAYRVTLDANDLRCTCEDFALRAKPCKHIYAAAFVVQRQTVTETTTVSAGLTTTTTVTETQTMASVRISYPQNWPAYNKAQTQEKAMFCSLLRDLASSVPEREQSKGRPRIPVADAIFCGGYKVYTTVSSRRFMTDLREAHTAGYVARAYHFNSVLNAIEDETLTPILYDLVTASAAPLGAVESTFAVDSTGFGTVLYYRHFAAKYGGDLAYDAHDWLKLHALVGCKTNVIAAARITERNGGDAPQMIPLLNAAEETFNLKNITADKAYASRKNVAHIAEMHANPYIALRSDMKSMSQKSGVAGNDSMAWRWLWHLYNLHREEFLSRYHARSNAESTFSGIKRVFGDSLRSKTRVAQENELLLKVICWNITCLIHSIFELGIEMPSFAAQNRADLHTISTVRTP